MVADNDNPFVPGIFKGAADAVQGAAKYINANGGIAGRKLVVDVYDSKLNANETRNAFISACEKDFALVGTTSLFVTTFDDVVNCKDAKGEATGIPDIGGLITSLTEACSPVTFSPNAPQVQCDTVGQDPVTYQGTMGPFKYAVQQLKGRCPRRAPHFKRHTRRATCRRGQHGPRQEGRGEARRRDVVVEPRPPECVHPGRPGHEGRRVRTSRT